MKLGIIGLGRMGNAIAYRVINAGFEVVGYDPSVKAQEEARKIGVEVVDSIQEVGKRNDYIWLMVPVGDPVDAVIKELLPTLKTGNIIVDGGNSKWTDSIKRADMLAVHDVFFLDCGTSGGLLGRSKGFSLMIGGDKAAYTKIHPILEAIAAPGGVAHVGPSGSGHYVKMVHNGIEYAILEAYAEGLHLLKDGSFKDTVLDLEEITRIWSSGSVIRSWLLELAHDVMAQDQELATVAGEVAEGGTGKWTVEDAHKHDIPVPVIEESLKIRKWSRETGGNYATKVIAMLRNKFGGHQVKKN